MLNLGYFEKNARWIIDGCFRILKTMMIKVNEEQVRMWNILQFFIVRKMF